MKNKLFTLGILILFLIGSIGTAFADTGYLQDEKTAILNENDTQVAYNSICIDKDRTIYLGQQVNTTDNITTREGVIDYIVNNWNNSTNATSQYHEVQEGVWNITQNTSIPFVTYEDNYTVIKTHVTDNYTNELEIDGILRNVTFWVTHKETFTFRMLGDSWNIGTQDLLIFHYLYEVFGECEVQPLPEPPVCNNTTNETPVNPINNTTNETPVIPINNTNNTPISNTSNESTIVNNTTQIVNIEEGTYNPIKPVGMKKTGISYVLIIFIVIIALGCYIGYRKYRT